MTGWQTTTIEESCNVEYGTRVVQKRDGGSVYPVYGGGGATFQMDTANRADRVVVSRFGMSEECTRFVDGEFFLNDSGLTLSPKDKAKLLPAFLDLLTLALNDKIFALGKGAAQKNLDVPAFRGLRVTYPSSLTDQRHIVATLDQAFGDIATAKANAERNLQNSRELFASQREVVLSGRGSSWNEALIRDLCDITHGYAFEGEFFATAGDYVLLTPGNYYESGGYRDRGERQKYFVGPIPRDYVLSEGSLLVAMTEQAAGLLGSPLLVPEPDRFLHNQRLGLVVGKLGVAWDNEFFFHVFNLARVRAEIHASASGVKVRHTSPSRIGAISVVFPSTVAEQREVASKLLKVAAECDQLVSVYERKITALDELTKSLLHQAFSGTL
jgi:type I restriction enzyme S subunit